MGYNMSNIIVNLKKEIAEAGGGGSSELDSRVSALEETVGDSSSGLVKDVSDIGTSVGSLEETVGDSESGLVKDVSDLETSVGALNANVYDTTEVKVGKWGEADLYRKYITIPSLPNSTTGSYATGLSTETVRRMEFYYDSSSEFGAVWSSLGSVSYNKSTKKVDVSSTSDMSSYSGVVILEYTKPSNNAKGGKK